MELDYPLGLESADVQAWICKKLEEENGGAFARLMADRRCVSVLVKVFADACFAGASDAHVEKPGQGAPRVKLRLAGELFAWGQIEEGGLEVLSAALEQEHGDGAGLAQMCSVKFGFSLAGFEFGARLTACRATLPASIWS